MECVSNFQICLLVLYSTCLYLDTHDSKAGVSSESFQSNSVYLLLVLPLILSQSYWLDVYMLQTCINPFTAQ